MHSVNNKEHEAYGKPPAYSEVADHEAGPAPQYPHHQQPVYPGTGVQCQYGQQVIHPVPDSCQQGHITGYYYAAPGQPAPANMGPGGVIYQQPTIVMVAPQPITNPPNDYLIYSILVTILCCWPIGIFAIIKSVNCRDAAKRGDVQNAVRYSNEAKKYASIALGVGIAVIVLWIVIVLVYYMFILNMITMDY